MRLIETRDAHFAWLLGERSRAPADLASPPGGVDEPETLRALRDGVARRGARIWLMTARSDDGGGEVVGLCGTKGPPRAGTVEIGYGVAPSRRGRGHAGAAVALLLAELRAGGLLLAAAQTGSGSHASERVLDRAGFARAGERQGANGPTTLWWRAL